MQEPVAGGNAGPSPGLPAAAAAGPQAGEEIVERWWEDHFPGSPVAQVTAAWNHAFAAKEALKRRLADLIAEGQ